MRKFYLYILLSLMLSSCAQNVPDTIETVPTEIQKEEVIQPVVETESDEKLIEKALLKHYDSQFGCNDSDIKSTGFLMYRIEDIGNDTKKAYGFANYMEYNIEGDKVHAICGSGTTAVTVTFDKTGKETKVYEVLTDNDYQSEKFKSEFPEDIQDKILERNQNDIEEVNRLQKEMVKRLYKEKVKSDLTTEIFDSYIDFIEDEE